MVKVKGMSYCPKCGTKVLEEMSFCPKCGAALKVEQPPAEAAPPAPYRAEKAEKHEKREKEEKEEREKKEKTEKHEKREFGWWWYIGLLVGGLILICLGLMFYLAVTASISWGFAGALFFVIMGIIIIAGVAYAAMMATRKHPET